MLSPAILGGIGGAIISTLLPLLFGAARQWVPRWFGFLRIAYVRTFAATVGGLAAAAGISLSISDHSHKELTYIMWYGIAALGFTAAFALTIVIDRRLMQEKDAPERTAPLAASTAPVAEPQTVQVLPTSHYQAGKLAAQQSRSTSAPEQPRPSESPLSDAEGHRILEERIQRAVREGNDRFLRTVDAENKGAVQSDFERPASNGENEQRLVTIYREGEQLRAKILLSASSIVGDLIRATANQRQVEREQWARDWDRRVLDILAADARQKWTAAGTLPANKLDYVSTIAGVRAFLAEKLDCLREIIAGSEADENRAEPLSLAPSEVEQREKRTRSIKAGEEFARLILQAELQDEGPTKARQTLFYNLGATVEAWARTIGAEEEVPKFSGDPGADLARLKVFVAKELARLRAEQEHK